MQPVVGGHRDTHSDVKRSSRTRSSKILRQQVRKLEGQLRQKDKELAESRTLLQLLTQVSALKPGGRGRLHGAQERSRLLSLIEQSTQSGARLESVCRLLGLSARTVQRWRKPQHAEDKRPASRRQPANRLSLQERQLALELLRFASHQGLSPRQLVPRLADQGIYVASESTFYRLARGGSSVRANARPRPLAGMPSPAYIAGAPNQLWSWDITYLRGPIRGAFLYLYLVMDLYSRRIMGWQIHHEESAENAARLIRTTCRTNGVDPKGLVLRSDNGRPMRGATLQYTLRRLGILPSFSRPQVSNDNPFSEALFRTLKTRPSYPKEGFSSRVEARRWVSTFVTWYNSEHLHRGLGFVTPDDRYSGRDEPLLAQRRALYASVRKTMPSRWSLLTRCWAPGPPVMLAALPSQATPPLQSTVITRLPLARGRTL